jgi:eukaryotic-like serine/threonine-protein kinase
VDPTQRLGGRYRLSERLGAGGMSVVWKAFDEVLERPVAVKVLSTRHVADQDSRARIRAEALAAGRLSHPNIANVYDYGESPTRDGTRVPYVVMELLTGRTLAQLASDGPLPAHQALRICAEVAAALAAAHAQGLVHRDVKPGNVVITASGAKVVDFGLAAVIGDLNEDEPNGVMYGTPAYLAPERLEGGPVVPGTDVYALGLMLYRLLAGALPWTTDTTTQMLLAHMYVEPSPLPPVDDLPADVAALISRCLAKDPADRPTADELAEALSRASGDVGPLFALFDGEGLAAPVARQSSLRRYPLAIVAAATVAALVVAGVLTQYVRFPDPAGARAQQPAGPVAGGSTNGAAASGQPGAAPLGANPAASTPAGGSAANSRDGGAGAAARANQSDPALAPAPPAAGGGTPTVASTGTATPTDEKTISSVGGEVTARCTGTSAYLVRGKPAEGFHAKFVVQGPASEVGVRFRSPTQRVTIRVQCPSGLVDSHVVVEEVSASASP